MPEYLQQLPVQQLKAFVSAHAQARPVLLDVREGWELALASIHLSGVPGLQLQLIPMGELSVRRGELSSTQPILALCHNGMRSLQCVAYLQQHGHAAVYNLTGGIDAWSREVDPSVPRY